MKPSCSEKHNLEDRSHERQLNPNALFHLTTIKNSMMLKNFLLLSLLFFLNCEKTNEEGNCGLRETQLNSPQTFKVLFIGNSHTYVNDVPGTIHQIAKSKGDSVYYKMSAPGGYDFQRHYKLAETISAIQSEKWDYVVLQESGWRTALIDAMMDTMVFPFADSLYHIIKRNNNTTKIILYMTQGYKNGASWSSQDPVVANYNGMQNRIKNTYIKLADNLNSTVAPAGLMWKIVLSKNPELELFNADGYHASPAGSYISACTIYSFIFSKKPENIYKPNNIADEDALLIQNTVTKALFDCNPDWRNF